MNFVSRWVPSGCTGGIWHHQRCLGARDEQWRLGALLGWGQPQCRLCRGLFDNAVSWRCAWNVGTGVEELPGFVGFVVRGTQRQIHGHFFLNGDEVDQRVLEYPIFRTVWFIGDCDSSWTYLFTNQWRFSQSRWVLTAVKSGCNLWYIKYFPDPLFQHALNMSAYVYVRI